MCGIKGGEVFVLSPTLGCVLPPILASHLFHNGSGVYISLDRDTPLFNDLNTAPLPHIQEGYDGKATNTKI